MSRKFPTLKGSNFEEAFDPFRVTELFHLFPWASRNARPRLLTLIPPGFVGFQDSPLHCPLLHNIQCAILVRMDSLLKTLPAILKAAGDSTEVAEAACIAAWKHAAGEGLRGNAIPLRLNDRTLIVAVADAAWQKQMQSLSGQLLFRLNSMLGKTLVTFLEFRQDPHVIARARKDLVQTDHDAEPTAIPAELVSAAAGIHDKDLRRAFLGAATSCIKRVENVD